MKKTIDWTFLVCVVAGWAIFLVGADYALADSAWAQNRSLAVVVKIVAGVAGGLAGSFVYSAFFQRKKSD